jgi:hypothetical protein
MELPTIYLYIVFTQEAKVAVQVNQGKSNKHFLKGTVSPELCKRKDHRKMLDALTGDGN